MSPRATCFVACLSCLGLVVLACSEPAPSNTPTQGAATAASAAPTGVAPPAASSSASAGSVPMPAASAEVHATPSASASAAPAELDLDASPALFDADGKPLGQTEDRPSTDSPAFQRRMKLLFDAIVANDPSIAEKVFFPVVAYEQVKDIKKPAADWKSRLMKAFVRDIGRHHRKLGPEPQACRYVGVDVDEKRVKWMERGKEGNKLGYHRVTRSAIRYLDPAGAEKTLVLTSLISWRGEWFVVHLDGFK